MNPRAATNDLLPFQGSPFGQLGYFSINDQIQKEKSYRFNRYDLSGEGGIRTHAPLRTNGFQDRLVMTTSIPLHILLCRFLFCRSRQVVYYHRVFIMSTLFFKFFQKFVNSVYSLYFTANTSPIFKSSGVVILIFS